VPKLLSQLLIYILLRYSTDYVSVHYSITHSSETSLSLSTTALAVARLGRVLGAGAGLAALAVFEAGLAAALEVVLAGACHVSSHVSTKGAAHLFAVGF
jgi:hypothetical protein